MAGAYGFALRGAHLASSRRLAALRGSSASYPLS